MIYLPFMRRHLPLHRLCKISRTSFINARNISTQIVLTRGEVKNSAVLFILALSPIMYVCASPNYRLTNHTLSNPTFLPVYYCINIHSVGNHQRTDEFQKQKCCSYHTDQSVIGKRNRYVENLKLFF